MSGEPLFIVERVYRTQGRIANICKSKSAKNSGYYRIIWVSAKHLRCFCDKEASYLRLVQPVLSFNLIILKKVMTLIKPYNQWRIKQEKNA